MAISNTKSGEMPTRDLLLRQHLLDLIEARQRSPGAVEILPGVALAADPLDDVCECDGDQTNEPNAPLHEKVKVTIFSPLHLKVQHSLYNPPLHRPDGESLSRASRLGGDEGGRRRGPTRFQFSGSS